eukprot:2590705-Prymnesium_polylepis.1
MSVAPSSVSVGARGRRALLAPASLVVARDALPAPDPQEECAGDHPQAERRRAARHAPAAGGAAHHRGHARCHQRGRACRGRGA